RSFEASGCHETRQRESAGFPEPETRLTSGCCAARELFLHSLPRAHPMAETLQQYQDTVVGEDGTKYEARACGAQMPSGLWHGWIEFIPIGDGETIRSGRETTQPNRTDII